MRRDGEGVNGAPGATSGTWVVVAWCDHHCGNLQSCELVTWTLSCVLYFYISFERASVF